MVERLPGSIIDMAQKNWRTLAALDAPSSFPDIQTSSVTGNAYLEQTYPRWNDPSWSPSNDRTLSIPPEKSALVEEMLAVHDIGLALVRPEMYHHTPAILDALMTFGFTINHVDDRTITPDQYQALYGSVFKHPIVTDTWATRTMVYLNSPCSMIIFSDPEHRFVPIKLADAFVQTYKGREGIRDPATIRGGVVFEEATRLGFHSLSNPTLEGALDPLVAYRHVVALPGQQPHSHIPKPYALLKYVAVSVHAPNSEELPRDLAALNSYGELQTIYEQVRK